MAATARSIDASNDSEVMEALGDERTREAAIAVLYQRFGRSLHTYARRRLGDPMLAEELVQETMVRLWRSAARFDPARGNLDCLTFTIASNVRVDILRRRRRALPTCPLEEAPVIAVGDRAAECDVALQVVEALATLSGEHREVIELAFRAGLSQSQIATHLGIPLGTVKTRTYWALRALRAHFDESDQIPTNEKPVDHAQS